MVNTSLNPSEILITTDDGYKYYFGSVSTSEYIKYLEVAIDRSSTMEDTKCNPVIIGWHLREIDAPNGRKVI